MAHPHAYPYHETHTAYNVDVPELGISVPEHMAPQSLRKDVVTQAAPPQASSAPDALSGGTAHKENAQAAIVGTSKAYGKYAAPYGTVTPGSPSNLKFYPLEGKHLAAEAQVAKNGYQHYFAGPGHAKPDLAQRNFNTKHLMIYAPEAGSGGDFGDESYTKSWRLTHELAHALTYPQLNQMYGEGRRIGALGKQRTTREALRAVHWEWMAAHKQRELAAELGVHIPDTEFHQELNTVMHDAVHRAVTGKFTSADEEGFRPHPHKVPLEQALHMVREAAQQMGLKDEHSLMAKAEPLAKRSKNVRQQTRDITPVRATARRTKYAQSIGLNPVPDQGRGRFPTANRNKLPHSQFFSVEHETAHAMMTPPGSTIRQYQQKLNASADPRKSYNSQGYSDERHAEGVHAENVANQLENHIDRRAGVGPDPHRSGFRDVFKPKDQVEMPDGWVDDDATIASNEAGEKKHGLYQYRNIPGEGIREEAKRHAGAFDDGARFTPQGRVAPATGLDARINQGLSGVARIRSILGRFKKHEATSVSTDILCPAEGRAAIFQEHDTMSDPVTRNDIKLGLAKALRDAVAAAQGGITTAAAAEARGQEQLAKTEGHCKACGAKAMVKSEAPGRCRNCGGDMAGMAKKERPSFGVKMTKAQAAAAKRDGRNDEAEELTASLRKDDGAMDTASPAPLDKNGPSCGKPMDKNAMAGYGPSSPGVGGQTPGMSKDEPSESLQGQVAPVEAAGHDDLDQVATGCPACQGQGVEHLGDMGNRVHFLCKGCGMTFSHPRDENAAATGEAGVDDPMLKDEFVSEKLKDGVVSEQASPGTVMPGDKKPKELAEAGEGSGGDISKGKLRKDAGGGEKAGPAKTKVAPPRATMTDKKTLTGLGGVPSGVGQITGAPSPHPETAASLRAIAGAHSPAPHPDTVASLKALPRPATQHPSIAEHVAAHFSKLPTLMGALGRSGTTGPAFVKKPSADAAPRFGSAAAKPAAPAAAPGRVGGTAAAGGNLATDKRAGGVGFLNNLISRFRKTPAAPPAGRPSPAGVNRAMAARMALAEKPGFNKEAAEKHKKDFDSVHEEWKGSPESGSGPSHKSLPKFIADKKPVKKAAMGTGVPAAPKPPKMPAAVAPKAPVTKASIPEVNKELAGFKSVASSPTKMPVGNAATGPAKPAAAPPSATAPKMPKVK